MNRIFIGLAGLHLIAMCVAAELGTLVAANGARSDWMMWHWHAGFWTSLLTLLVHSIVLTYFVGTGRWVREVGTVYGFDGVWVRRTWRTKLHAIPLIVASMLMAVVTAALGASVDPGSTVRLESWMGIPAAHLHRYSAIALFLVNLVSYWFEYAALRANATTISEVMEQVERVRRGAVARSPV